MRVKLTIEALDPLATNRLIGRDLALTELTEALESDKISVVGVIAPGGVGKSALVRTWLYSLVRTGYQKSRIQVWRFTDLAHHKNASSNLFFQSILDLDGESGKEVDSQKRPGTESSFISEDQKAKRLLEKLLDGQSILVLDQMEVLQYHGAEELTTHGRLYDEAIRRFLLGAAENPEGHSGRLVIVTSRERLTDLEDAPGYNPIYLDSFQEEPGAELLRSLGVVGTDRELQDATLEYGGNALALILLGRLIMSIPAARNRIAFRTNIPFFDNTNVGKLGGWKQAKDILAYYVANLGGPEEKTLLKMMGLFHRAMEAGPRNHLLHHANLTLGVRRLTDAEWQSCHNNLERFGLLIPAFSNPRDQWDCHPLIREHFRYTLKEESSELWHQAHQVLFEYFAGLPSEERPRTRQDLIPLYRAIPHGCLAERYADALRVYEDRVMQGPVIAYGTNELGAIAQDSAALSMFFKPEKTELLPGALEQLDIQKQAWLQARTAFCLTCLGRLEEATEHRKQELALCDRQRRNSQATSDKGRELLKNTAFATGMLSELHLLVGNLAEAERVSRKAIDFADQSNDWGQSMRCRCRLAAVLHMQGMLSEAETLFNEAVELQCSNQPQRPAMNSDHGFRFFGISHGWQPIVI